MRLPFRSAMAIAFVLLGANAAFSQNTLKYKFESGRKLPYLIDHEMKMTMDINGQAIIVKMKQDLDMVWEVKKVFDDGSASIVQRITRGRVKMDTPQGKIEFDSKAGAEPDDPIGKKLAGLYKVLVGADIGMKLSPRGAISDISIPKSILDAFKNDPALAQLGTMFTEAGMKQMMSQSMIAFPEKPLMKNDSWKGEPFEMTSNGVDAKMQVTDTFEGIEKQDGKDMARFLRKLTMEMKTNLPVQMKIKEQDTKVTVLFDVAAGKVSSTNLKQNFVLDVTQNNMTVSMTIEQNMKMTLGK